MSISEKEEERDIFGDVLAVTAAVFIGISLNLNPLFDDWVGSKEAWEQVFVTSGFRHLVEPPSVFLAVVAVLLLRHLGSHQKIRGKK